MPPSVAVLVCVLCVLWLFARDAKRQKMPGSLWIPLTWAFIVGSKPISLWLGLSGDVETAPDSVEESPFDRNVFLGLIVAGLLILFSRRLNWQRIIAANKWAFVYFAYLAISVLWSNDSFVSFKRWIKDFGNVIMVLVVLTEKDPAQGIKLVLARCSYILVPASLLLTRYYWALGGCYYDQWTGRPHYIGVAQDKNMWGMTLFVCGLFLIWRFLELREEQPRFWRKTDGIAHLALILTTLYLFYKAQSATAIVSTVLGTCIIIGMKFPAIRNRVRSLGLWGIGVALAALLLHASLNLGETFVEATGRDLTFTGRIGIWESVLKEDINPVIGEGFYSFWSAERNQRLSVGFYYLLGVAHNGYIETYLNSGLVGLALLVAMIAAAGAGIKRGVLNGSELGVLRLAFLITILLYNITESAFDRLVCVWFTLLLVMMECPSRMQAPRPVELEHPSLTLSAEGACGLGSPEPRPRLTS